MQQVQQGHDLNKSDFSRILQQFGDLVMTLCMRILNDKMMAEEASQDTFMKVFKGLSQFREEASLKTWIYRIAYRTAIDYARKKKRHDHIAELDQGIELGKDEPVVIDDLNTRERTLWLNHAISTLPPGQAALITLYYLQEKNVREVCSITGLTESNVKIKLFRARKALKGILADTKNMY